MKHFTNILIYISSSAYTQITGMVILVLLMQYLNIEEFSIYSYVTEFVGIFIFISDAGLAYLLTREISKNPETIKEIYLTAQFTQYLISILMFMCILISGALLNNEYEIYILIFGAAVSILSIFSPINSAWTALNERKLILLRDLMQGTLKLLFVILGIYLAFNVKYFLSSGIFIGIAWLFTIVLINNKYKNIYLDFTINKEETLKYIVMGIPFTLLLLTNVLYNKIDIIMIEKLLSIDDVGYYNAAMKFTYPIGFISTAVLTYIFPLMVSANSSNINQNKIFLNSILYLTLIGVIISLFLYFNIHYLFELLFNIKYNQSIPLFKIMIWFIPISFALGVVNNRLIANERMKFIIGLNIIMLIVNILLNYIYLPIYGTKSAAVITIICECIVLLISTIFIFNQKFDK